MRASRSAAPSARYASSASRVGVVGARRRRRRARGSRRRARARPRATPVRRREVGAHGLARPALGLLREVADGRARRRAGDAARVGRLDAGEDPQQRALAGAVRRDHADPAARADRDVDAVEHDVGAERLGDVAGDEAGERIARRGERGHGGTCGGRAGGWARGVPGRYITEQDRPVDEEPEPDFGAPRARRGRRARRWPGRRRASCRRLRSPAPASSTSSSCAATSPVATSPRPPSIACASSTAACIGIELGGATWRSVTVTDCRLDDANFRIAQLAQVRFEESVCARADFGGARLDDVQFPGCDLAGADFSNARVLGRGSARRAPRRAARRRVAARRDDRRRPAVRARARTGRRDRAARARRRRPTTTERVRTRPCADDGSTVTLRFRAVRQPAGPAVAPSPVRDRRARDRPRVRARVVDQRRERQLPERGRRASVDAFHADRWFVAERRSGRSPRRP